MTRRLVGVLATPRVFPRGELRAAMVEDVYLIGPRDKVRDDLAAWRESCVTTMLVSGPPTMLEEIAEIVNG